MSLEFDQKEDSIFLSVPSRMKVSEVPVKKEENIMLWVSDYNLPKHFPSNFVTLTKHHWENGITTSHAVSPVHVEGIVRNR